ncbi:MAG: Na/Pi cotransporter family protein [Clostridiales bacterium]|nr:Na/Pi cotransporter family protein [Clostridiales bacterium]
MDIFSVLTMFGGLALFLYGMNALGDGLAKLSGGRLEKILEKLTSSKIKGVLLGAVVTAAIQSSSATTVMVVGFVNSGIMKLTQAISIIMGANIGTTATSWILSLSGIESDSTLIQLLKPSSFSPIFAIIGIIMIMFSKKERMKDVGNILIGFAILMFGMETMSAAVKPLANNASFTSLLTMFTNPVLGVVAGALLTAIIQSSSASVGILQALCVTGSLNYSMVFPIVLGQNIGTCVTAMISSIGASKNAKRTALVHLYFNLMGVAIFMIGFYSLTSFIDFAFLDDVVSPADIAILHSTFNIGATLLLLPFTKGLEKLARLTIRNDKDDEKAKKVDNDFRALDLRFLDQPSYAIDQARKVTISMAYHSKECLFKAMSLLENYDEEIAKDVVELENRVDKYEDRIGTYLVKISSRNLSESDSRVLTELLHCIGDFERIADHAVNLLAASKEMHEKKLVFSEEANKELKVFSKAIRDIVESTVVVFEEKDMVVASIIEPMEEVIDNLSDELKNRHIRRLAENKCTIELGFIFSDITTNFERISDHCSNVAVCLIQVDENEYETHEYLDYVKHDNAEFKEKYNLFKEKYILPKM